MDKIRQQRLQQLRAKVFNRVTKKTGLVKGHPLFIQESRKEWDRLKGVLRTFGIEKEN